MSQPPDLGRLALAPGTQRTTDYDLRPPSPPLVEVQSMPRMSYWESPHAAGPNEKGQGLEPAYQDAQLVGLTPEELKTITGGRLQYPDEKAKLWAYEDRRMAHPILDYLWLGPSAVTRDHEYMKSEAFTLIIVANEMRMPGQKLRSIETAAEALNVEVKYIDVQQPYQQVGAFNDTVRIINDHVLDRARIQGKGSGSALPLAGVPTAKVLVVCETGNYKSTMIVTSYIMAMYCRSMADAVQDVLARRLSCAFDENSKRALQTWGDILQARKAVASHETHTETQSPTIIDRPTMMKRGFADTVEMEIDGDEEGSCQQQTMYDHDRFANRETFTPFRDVA